MKRSLPKAILQVLCVPLALILTGCPIEPTQNVEDEASDPVIEFEFSEEDILAAREKYRVSTIGLKVVDETPDRTPNRPAQDAVAALGSMAESAAGAMAQAADAEESPEGEEEMLSESPQGPRQVELLADLVVRFVGPGKPLPGITVDITHADPYGIEKARHLVWAETPGLRRGEKRSVPVRLEVDNYEDGDEFYVEFQEFVPPEARSGYREFAMSGE